MDFVVEDFTMTVIATLEAVIRHELQTNVTGVILSQTSFTYSDDTSQKVDVIVDEGADLSQGLVLTILEANCALDFYVD